VYLPNVSYLIYLIILVEAINKVTQLVKIPRFYIPNKQWSNTPDIWKTCICSSPFLLSPSSFSLAQTSDWMSTVPGRQIKKWNDCYFSKQLFLSCENEWLTVLEIIEWKERGYWGHHIHTPKIIKSHLQCNEIYTMQLKNICPWMAASLWSSEPSKNFRQ
jgi:hypothetical protein